MKMLIPLVLLLIGIGGGVGAGLALRSAPHGATHAGPQGRADGDHAATTPAADHAGSGGYDDGHGGGGAEYIKLNNQFVVPIVTGDSVESLVVMSLSLEMASGESEAVYRHEPKLRDVFLQVLFDHANMGGFRGIYTDTARLDTLRGELLDVAKPVLGSTVTAVLITELIRREM